MGNCDFRFLIFDFRISKCKPALVQCESGRGLVSKEGMNFDFRFAIFESRIADRKSSPVLGFGAGGDGTQCACGGCGSGRFTQMRPGPQGISTDLIFQCREDSTIQKFNAYEAGGRKVVVRSDCLAVLRSEGRGCRGGWRDGT